MGYMSSAHRDGIRRAIADREQGRNKVRSTTTAVTMASVVTAGALALVLPGSTHKTDTSTSTGSSSSSSGSSGSTGSGSASSGSTGSGSTSSGSGSTGSGSACSGSSNSNNSGSSSSSSGLVFGFQSHLELGQQPGHLRRLLVLREADSCPAETSASWRALGTLVQLVVTDPRCLPEARRLLAAELDAVDAACSRFRPDSEICSLARPWTAPPWTAPPRAVRSRSARCSPRPSRSRSGRPG